mmetsp:Transcript_50091/g.125604  ORF Transcript_50091/g.125604 Transcript_50091/m.125604 type:complete len:247 (-) Transcript_50091:731-1471(-)
MAHEKLVDGLQSCLVSVGDAPRQNAAGGVADGGEPVQRPARIPQQQTGQLDVVIHAVRMLDDVCVVLPEDHEHSGDGPRPDLPLLVVRQSGRRQQLVAAWLVVLLHDAQRHEGQRRVHSVDDGDFAVCEVVCLGLHQRQREALAAKGRCVRGRLGGRHDDNRTGVRFGGDADLSGRELSARANAVHHAANHIHTARQRIRQPINSFVVILASEQRGKSVVVFGRVAEYAADAVTDHGQRGAHRGAH